MICAYYDCTSDSLDLFKDYNISRSETFRKHINKYNVIYIDTTSFISSLNVSGKSILDLPNDISEAIRNDIIMDMPELNNLDKVSDCILAYAEKTNRKFVFIIDEWDAVIREAKDNSFAQKKYLNLL